MLVKFLRAVFTTATILAFVVVMLGAYTRLMDAGLGCPDWPGCYGHLLLPMDTTSASKVPAAYEGMLIEPAKAWKEMIHRYAAGTLALLIAGCALSIRPLRKRGLILPSSLLRVLVLLVVFQAALGMWTVTLKLLPIVVMGHLLGGLLIFACLCAVCWQETEVIPGSILRPYRCEYLANIHRLVAIGIVIVFCQIALGGWVSSNYAGIACIGFPRCNGQWFPALHMAKAFNLFSAIGFNYQGGLLDSDARMTIQFIHRLGAYVTALYVMFIAVLTFIRAKHKPLRVMSIVTIVLILLQIGLGVINVLYLLPVMPAVAHSGVAALLLASMVSLYYLTGQSERESL